MAQNNYNGKWSDWIWKVSNGRWIVAENRDGTYFTKVTVDSCELGEIRGHNPLDLVAKGAQTYANPNAAIKSLKRVYNPEDASQARTEERPR